MNENVLFWLFLVIVFWICVIGAFAYYGFIVFVVLSVLQHFCII